MIRPITFDSNLKYYRLKKGITQKQLADQIGYTEKTISKWERGGGLPTVEILLKLADLFAISLDELVFEKTSTNYFLGIDGGGTKTEFKLVDENGTVLNHIYKGACNPIDIGIENAKALLKEGINEICKGISYSNITMYAGISGAGSIGGNAKILKHFFSKFGFFAFDNGSDIENLFALSNCEKSIVVIMGTGFVVYTNTGKHQRRISGWGQLFDEGGSGYSLGRDAITAALCEEDGSGKNTLLTTFLKERVGEAAEIHLPKFYQGGKQYIASFADIVFEAANVGDETACKILEKNMAFVAHRIDAAVHSIECVDAQKIPVLFSGGISKNEDMLFPLIEKHMTNENCSLKRLQIEPVEGALIRAKKIFDAKKQRANGEKDCE